MRQICEKCETSFDDEFRDTICPHKGIGYCEICDCVICVCDPERKAKIHAQRMPMFYWSKGSDPQEWPKIKRMGKLRFMIRHPVIYWRSREVMRKLDWFAW